MKNTLKLKDNSLSSFQNIKKAIINDEDFLSIDATFHLTKGKASRNIATIFRDKALEKTVRNWLYERLNFEDIMQRYKKYYPTLTSLEWPSHYATRFINLKGNATKGENIFMFFPEALGFHTARLEDYFGFEFIDVWVSIFDEIVFPCMRQVFDEKTQLQLFGVLRPALEKTIFLAAVFHEVGHRCGYWKVSPTKDYRIHINKFNTDVLGELATDTLLVNFLTEFPEVQYFVFLQRLFWFGRFGFKTNNVSGKLNTDNDTWIGSYLWNQYINHKVLTQNDDQRWTINFEKLSYVYKKVLDDIDYLGERVVNQSSNQDQVIQQWMKDNVLVENEKFIFHKDLQSLFLSCNKIIDRPSTKF